MTLRRFAAVALVAINGYQNNISISLWPKKNKKKQNFPLRPFLEGGGEGGASFSSCVSPYGANKDDKLMERIKKTRSVHDCQKGKEEGRLIREWDKGFYM